MESGSEDRNTEGVYINFVEKLLVSQKQHILERTIKEHINETKWITATLEHYIGFKRNIYKRLTSGQRYLLNQSNALARTVKEKKRNVSGEEKYEVRIASQATTDPRSFFQVY